jgi:hypothetical protein
MTTVVTAERTAGDAGADWADAARTLATVTWVGAVAGGLVVGVLGRLAMMLLAVLNPEVAGVRSDDGFPIGEFTVSGSLQLALAGVQLGVTGAFAYLVFRGLMVGPAWFRLLSISLGPGLVVGALVVHTDGVDFPLLDPPALAASLFVAIPTVFVAVLHVFSERALASRGRLPVPLLVLGLLPWVVLVPLTLVLAGGFATLRALRRSARGRSLLANPWPAWVVRGLLAGLVLWAVVDLVRDVSTLS